MSRAFARQAEREARRAASRPPAFMSDEARRSFVEAAANAFMQAIRAVSANLAMYDAHKVNGVRYGGPARLNALIVWRGPKVDVRARVLCHIRHTDGAFVWRHERRTRALIYLTAPQRRAFVEAVQFNPSAAQWHVRAARAAFAHALREARARDRVAMEREGEGNGL